VPEAKLIAILRDPAESAYSGFLMTRKNGRKPLSDFARALEAEEGRVKDDWWIGRYKRKGFYHAELSLYYGLFGPEQIRVYLHEDLEEDPSGVVRNAHGFLGVDDSFCPDVSLRYNKSGFPKSGALCKVFQRPHPIKSGLKRLLPKGFRRRTHMRLQNKVLVKPPFPMEVRRELKDAYREDILMLRSSKTVHKRSSPMSLRSGRATPHPRFRFAIQLSGGDSCRMRLATSCGGADAGPKNPGPLRPAVLLATRPRSVGAR